MLRLWKLLLQSRKSMSREGCKKWQVSRGQLNVTLMILNTNSENAQDAMGEDTRKYGARGVVPEEEGVDEGEEDGPNRAEQDVRGPVRERAIRPVVMLGVAGRQPCGNGELGGDV
jgi:hypothetical protein